MEKMTYVSMLNDVKNGVALTAEHIEKIDALIERLSKPHTKSDKPTKAQLENEKLQMNIYDSMATDYKYSVSDMIKMFPILNGLSTQKVTPQISALIDKGLVRKVEEKRKSLYVKIIAE